MVATSGDGGMFGACSAACQQGWKQRAKAENVLCAACVTICEESGAQAVTILRR